MIKFAIIYFMIAHLFNAYSTKITLVDNPWFFRALNPFLGEDPSPMTIAIYFILTGIIALVIALTISNSFLATLGLTVYGTLNMILAIRDFYLLGRIKRRPEAPENIKIISMQ